MLWKDDFKSDRDWQAVCRALGLPENTVEVELRCNVRVAKSNYTHARLHKPEPFSFARLSNKNAQPKQHKKNAALILMLHNSFPAQIFMTSKSMRFLSRKIPIDLGMIQNFDFFNIYNCLRFLGEHERFYVKTLISQENKDI